MSSDYKESANKRRDLRNTKVSDESRQTSKIKKDTKRWCKGKVGKKHKTVCLTHAEAKKEPDKLFGIFGRRRYLVCLNCGKELEIYFGGKNKPDWVNK